MTDTTAKYATTSPFPTFINSMDDVKAALKAWKDIQPFKDRLIALFDNLSGFNIYQGIVQNTGSGMHIYPGVITPDDGEDYLVFFMVQECFDDGFSQPLDHMGIGFCQEGLTLPDLLPHPQDNRLEVLPRGSAYDRIKNWQENYNAWILGHPNDLFHAFHVPAIDLVPEENAQYTAWFALREPIEEERAVFGSNQIADLIIVKTVAIYSDTVRPVPPFKPYRNFLLSLTDGDLL
jgi:hypothetical protein